MLTGGTALGLQHGWSGLADLGPLLPFNPSSPKGGCTNPPNGFRPGA